MQARGKQGESKANENNISDQNTRNLTNLETHFKVMAGIKSNDPDAVFSAWEMYGACRERGSAWYQAAFATLGFCVLGKLSAGIMPWSAVRLKDVTKFMHSDSSKSFKADGSVDTARITALTQRADREGNITQPVHAAYVEEYQAEAGVPHSFAGKTANKGEWGGYWDDQQFATTNADGVKVVNASKYSRFFTDPESVDQEVKQEVKAKQESAQEKGRSSWCPSFGR